MIAKAIRDRLVADSTVTDFLSIYDLGSGAVAAVFTEAIPEDASTPLVEIVQTGGDDDSRRSGSQMQVEYMVTIYASKDYAQSRGIVRIANHIWNLLNQATVTADSGYASSRLRAAPPTDTPDPDGFPGRTIRVTAYVAVA